MVRTLEKAALDRAVCHGAVTAERGRSQEGVLGSLEVEIPIRLDPRLLISGHPRGKSGRSKSDSMSDFPYAGLILSSWLDGCTSKFRTAERAAFLSPVRHFQS